LETLLEKGKVEGIFGRPRKVLEEGVKLGWYFSKLDYWKD